MYQTPNKTPFISVILPVYNGEPYIKRCVNSMLAQDFGDFELLIIDDGSEDGCLDLLQKEYGAESRVKIFHQGNKGESGARNTGLNNALGEWITFIDQDDYVDKDYLSAFMVVEPLREDTLYIVGEKEGFCQETLSPQKDIYESGTKNPHTLRLLSNNGTTWGKLFLRKIIEEFAIRYNEKVFYGGDKLFTMQYAAHIERIIYNHEAYPYNYINPFNPFKFVKPFDQEVTNYTEIALGMQKEYKEDFQTEWLVKHLFVLLLSLYALRLPKAERREKLLFLKTQVPTINETLTIAASQSWKTRLLFGGLTKANPILTDRLLALSVPIAAKLFTLNHTPIFIKRFLKSVL